MDKLQGIRTNAFILNKDEKFLLLRRSLTDEFCAGGWELPGGKVEHGEDAIDACVREAKEETGLDITVLYPLTSYSYMMPEEGITKHMTQIVYLCSADTESVEISDEHSEYMWADFNHIDSFNEEQMSTILKDSFASIKTHPIISSN
jgi:8-oxo-dGTP diphosphatase